MKKTIPYFLVVVLILLAFNNTLVAQTIEGFVKDGTDGVLLPGINVYILDPEMETVTNSAGYYSFTGIEVGSIITVSIAVAEGGLSGSQRTFVVSPGVNLVNFWLNASTDGQGNSYSAIEIGPQIWMGENLKTTKYENGDDIGTTSPASLDITDETEPKYQWAYDGNESNVSVYGRLYTWYTISDIRKVCPSGWYIPTAEEWTSMAAVLGGEATIAGGMMKEGGFSHWISPNTGATNVSGFSGLPGGLRGNDMFDYSSTDNFGEMGARANWWTSTVIPPGGPGTSQVIPYRGLAYNLNSMDVSMSAGIEDIGFSVRCLKDGNVSIVSTALASEITSTTASCGGYISPVAGIEFDEGRGVCWSTSPNPTIDNSITDWTEDSFGTGSFQSLLTGLQPGTTYYVRAYGMNMDAPTYVYGNEISFTTITTVVPTVVTSGISDIRPISATCGGDITSDGGSPITAKGIVWNTTGDPQYMVDKGWQVGNTGIGSFVAYIVDVLPNTTYYVRAFAANAIGVAYGQEVTFETSESFNPAEFNTEINYGTVTDIDGNIYNTVQIGSIAWMAENLKTTRFNNGVEINNITDQSLWDAEDGTPGHTNPAYCWYNNNALICKDVFGGLYNWYAASNDNLCPVGWRVPTYEEWTALFNSLGGINVAGNPLKETGVSHWASPNPGATNSTGFTALGGGLRGTGGFFYIAVTGFWWSQTGIGTTDAWNINLNSGSGYVGSANNLKRSGMSIRCIREVASPALVTSEITEITSTTAVSGGEIQSDGGSAITEKGICWSISENPTTEDNKTSDGSGVGPFVSNINNLTPGTIYYIRAYATNSVGTAYGNEMTLRTFNTETASDNNGNIYNTVTIGDQTWMVQNLKSTTYNDGSPIDNPGSDNTAWENNTTGAYCWYSDDEASYKEPYGALYNWYSVNTGKLCPTGWHVPTDNEWTILTNYLGGAAEAGGKLKETGTIHWTDPNEGATNETGFTAVGGGYRDTDLDIFTNINNTAHFWSSTENNIYGLGRSLYWCYTRVDPSLTPKNFGYSVRCIENNTITVTNVSDEGTGSLRQAILDANSIPGTDNIEFNISGDGPHTIIPSTPLPDITESVIIDGYTQQGSQRATLNAPAALMIEIFGGDNPSINTGLNLSCENSTISGLMINHFLIDGIELNNGGGNIIEGNYIGVDALGQEKVSPESALRIIGSSNNMIGGDLPENRNVMAGGPVGNSNLIFLLQDASKNIIKGNYLGVGPDGSTKIGSTKTGIRASDNPKENIIGPGNIISGHSEAGIFFHGTGPETVSRNTIIGNYIGTNFNGSVAVANETGIAIWNSGYNIIGGNSPDQRNIISGNTLGGIELRLDYAYDIPCENVVTGNFIGTNASGDEALANNKFGVRIYSNNNTIGGTGPGEGNLISGNLEIGISVEDAYSKNNKIIGNLIGTTADGEGPLGNQVNGISINDADNTEIRDNVISGNGGLEQNPGILISNGSTGTQVLGNLIGTNATGFSALKNSGSGINIGDSPGNSIGSLAAGERNIIYDGIQVAGEASTGNNITGNYLGFNIEGESLLRNGTGILLYAGASENDIGPGNVLSGISVGNAISIQNSNTHNNKVFGNLIGVTPDGVSALSNNNAGIEISDSPGNIIGGLTPDEKNVISGSLNYNNGINIGGSSSIGNQVSGNFIGTDISGNYAIGNAGGGIGLNNGASQNIIGPKNVISGNKEHGIHFEDEITSGNKIIGNLIGTTENGMTGLGNQTHGVWMNASNNTIGGTTIEERNVISANGYVGIEIGSNNVSGNIIKGNYLGTDITGNGSLLNSAGDLSLNNSSSSLVGGLEPGARNVIGSMGIGNEGAHDNLVIGNYIGLKADGTGPINAEVVRSGILISDASDNTIGPGNIISGVEEGIWITEYFGVQEVLTTNTKIIGNLIGTNSSGTGSVPNRIGIHIQDVQGIIIGGSNESDRNVISGNQTGLVIDRPHTRNNYILGNFIGTDISGQSAIPNGTGISIEQDAGKNYIGGPEETLGNIIAYNSSVGIGLGSDSTYVQANEIAGHSQDGIFIAGNNNIIGGTETGSRNFFHNNYNGIRTGFSADYNTIEGNYLGTDRKGEKDLTDGWNGVALSGRFNLVKNNLISGYNNGHGIYIQRWDEQKPIPEGNRLEGNIIGMNASETAAIPNQHGITINTAIRTTIYNNIIAGNQYYGINIDGQFFTENDDYHYSVGNKISQNSVYSNGLIGIDLGLDDVSDNDALDNDPGSNELQNFPVLETVSFSPGVVNISGQLNSEADSTYTLEFFASKLADEYIHIDSKHYGEGQFYLGSQSVTTDANGNASFTFSFPIKSGYGQVITATATDNDGNTSEFSNAIGGLADQEVGTEWPLHYSYNELGVENITDGSDITAIENAFQTWSDVSTADIEFVSDGSTEAKYASAEDGVNLVSFVDDQFPWTKGVLAYAAKTIKMDENDNQAQIIDADIIVNPDFVNSLTGTLGVADEGDQDYYDIQSVLTHEIGHLLGLIHSGVVDATMFFWINDGDTRARSLEPDDKAWVSYKYPGENYSGTYGTLSGNITYGYDPFPKIAGALVTATSNEEKQFHSYSDAYGDFIIPVERNNSYTIDIQPLDGDVNGYPMKPGNISSYIYSNTIYIDYPDEFYSGEQGELDEADGEERASVMVSLTGEPVNITTNPDLTPPDVLGITPKPEDMPVKVMPDIIIQFSESIDVTSLSDETCWLESAGIKSYGNFTELGGSSDVIIFTPNEPLEYGATYILHLANYVNENTPCITDLKGNGLISTYPQYSIETIEADQTKPAISSIIPNYGAEGVFVTEKIMVFFSEPMNRSSVESGFNLSSPANADVEGSFSWKNENTLMIFTPLRSLFEDTQYTISFQGEIDDLSLNPMDPVSPSIFTTVTAVEPQIIYLEPGNKITDNVSVTSPVVVDFSEPVDPSTVNTTTFTLHSADGTMVSGNFEFLNDNSRVIFRPVADLKFSTLYTVELTGEIKDVSPVSLNFDPAQIKDEDSGETWIPASFTTDAATSAPDIFYIDPPGGVNGALVTITGEGFDPDPADNSVTFADMPATVRSATLTTIVVEVPKGVLSGMVYVTVNGKTTDPGYYFYVIPQSLDPCEEGVASVNTGSRSRDVVVSGDATTAYVTNPGSNSISVIDLVTLTPDSQYDPITLGIGTSPLKIDINPAGTRAYVTNFGSHTVSVIDLTESSTKNQVIDEIKVGLNPYGIVVTPDGERIYVSNYSSDNLSVIDADPNSGGFDHVVANVNTGTRNRDITVTADAGMVLVAGDNGITIINSDPSDIDYNCVIANSSTGSRTRDVAVSGDAGIAFATTEDGQLLVIDIAPASDFFGAVIANVSTGSRARDVTTSGDALHLYVTTDDNKVLVYQINPGGTPEAGGSYAGLINLTLHATIEDLGNEGLVIDAENKMLYTVYSGDIGQLRPLRICCGPITPEIAIGNLIIRVQNMINNDAIMESLGNELIHKLNLALDDLNDDKTKQTINDLKSFITKVQDFVRSNKITSDQGQVLIDAANEIITLLKGTKSDTEYNQITDMQLPDYNSTITESKLGTIYPNPFSESVMINYEIAESVKGYENVQIYIYDVIGRLVGTAVDRDMQPGRYSVVWSGMYDSGGNVPRGTYFVQFRTDTKREVKRIMLIR